LRRSHLPAAQQDTIAGVYIELLRMGTYVREGILGLLYKVRGKWAPDRMQKCRRHQSAKNDPNQNRRQQQRD
jgi:hypothetical protein